MLIDKLNSAVKYLIFFSVIALIFYAVPKKKHYEFNVNVNEIWHKSDLYAPFSFPILKTEEELKKEKDEIIRNFKPVLKFNNDIFPEVLTEVYKNDNLFSSRNDENQEGLKSLENELERMYTVGVYNPLDIDFQFKSGIVSVIMPDNSMMETSMEELYSLNQVKEQIKYYYLNDSLEVHIKALDRLLKNIKANLQYDKNLTDQLLESKFAEILPYSGMVNEGDKIIENGSVVTKEKYQILLSLKQSYTGTETGGINYYLNHIGYLLIILLLFIVFVVYIFQFYKQIYQTNKDLLLIFSLVVIFILVSAYLVKNTGLNIYLVPFCIVPLIIISFFEARIAFFSHIIVIATVSLFIPDAHEFLLLQVIAGLSVVILISRVRYISQFFIAVLLLTGIYIITFFGIKLLNVSDFSEINWRQLLWFGGNFILTLLAYPLIYAFEKLFGKVSDLTLIELSDINKKLLKELATRAPGTFQHSLQLATLTEAVLSKIGGNSLLAKVGCLYHDIGKLYAPMYFIENQKDVNPFEKIQSEKECASIIIRHVTEGVKIAKEHNLPKEVIHFIKTHHGTTRVEYFYRTYLKKNPEDTGCEDQFRYPGPKPTSKEMAVVMIADSIEAATRSLKEQTPEAIDQLVDMLVENKMKDNQFQNANITLKEIKIAKDIIKNSLRSIYHQRIQYPSEN